MANYNEQTERQWNGNEEYIARIGRRWEAADQAKQTGDALTYFRSLETIYMAAHDFFSQEEQVEITQDVKAIEKLLENNYGGGTAGKMAAGAGMFIGENKCDLLYMKLTKLLFKYKVLYVKMEEHTWQEELEADFK